MSTTLSIAFLAGLVSFLSPCVLPLIPGYISYISGESLGGIVKKQKKILLKNLINCEVIPANIDEDLIKESLLKENATPEIISKSKTTQNIGIIRK